jgi:hypothetical protein
MKRRIGIMTRRGRSLSPAAQALIDTLRIAAMDDRKKPEFGAGAVLANPSRAIPR